MATRSPEAGGAASAPEARGEIAFLLLDGLRRSRPPGSPEAALCALGLTREGTPHPLALRVVPQEDERSWRALLQDLKADGIGAELLLITADGHPALVKAIHAVFPDTPLQVSVAHRLLALSRKVDTRWRAACLAEARQIFAAPDRAAAVALFRDWQARWLKQGEPAVRSLEPDLAACLAFYRFPSILWNKIRTVNMVERSFRDTRRAATLSVPVPAEAAERVIEREASISEALPSPPAGPAEVARGERIPRPAGEPHEWAIGVWSEGGTIPGRTPPAMVDRAPAAEADAVQPLTAAPAAPHPPAAPTDVAPDAAALPSPAPPAPADPTTEDARGVLLHVSSLREPEAVLYHVALGPDAPSAGGAGALPHRGPRRVELSADEAFEEWLRTYRQRTLRLRLVMVFASAAGLLAGLALSLRR